MDEYMENLFRNAVAYDKSTYCRTEEYASICARQLLCRHKLYQSFTPDQRHLLEEFIRAVNEEMTLERKHAFFLGYQAAKEQ